MHTFTLRSKKKGREFAKIVKIGRTDTMDATPITLGQEFSGYAAQVKSAFTRLGQAQRELYPLAQGGTAVGTGIKLEAAICKSCRSPYRATTKLPFVSAANKFEHMAGHDAYVFVHGAINSAATALYKIAWGLALRKRFCRQFNFELQAAATEDGLLLSLGPQHSFPLADVFRYLHAATANDVLVQAFLDAPVFQTRWRWNTTISLAVPRNRHGKKVAPPLQRMMADDLMAAVFPDAAACLENIPGDREIPDHPLVQQTIHDCLQEAMDYEQLATILDRIHRGELRLLAVDTTEPSPLCHELVNARPYAFLDDAPLEERRTHAVYARRAGQPGRDSDLGALDASAIERVCDEERPDPRDADELHDALLTMGFLTRRGKRARSTTACFASWPPQSESRRVTPSETADWLWAAVERLPELRAIDPRLQVEGDASPPPSRAAQTWTRETALVEIAARPHVDARADDLRRAAPAARRLAADMDQALETLESQGVVLRGRVPSWPG